MTARPQPRRRATGVAIALTAAVALSSCAGQTPGAAIVVEGTQISTSRVAETARDICLLSEEQLTASQQVLPMSVMTRRAVELLTLAEVGPQIAEEFDVELGAEYQELVAGYQREAEALPAAARDTYVELSSALVFVTQVTEEVGRAALAEDGVSSPSGEDLSARGEEVLAQWLTEKDITVNPRYGVGIVDGALAEVPTDLSVAVSDTALAGQAEEVDVTTAASLPEAQRCG